MTRPGVLIIHRFIHKWPVFKRKVEANSKRLHKKEVKSLITAHLRRHPTGLLTFGLEVQLMATRDLKRKLCVCVCVGNH